MKYLKYFESGDSTLDKIKDVFENLDLEYDIDVKVGYSPDSLYVPSPNSKIKRISTIKYYIYLKFSTYPDRSFGDHIVNLIEKCEEYAGVKFTIWILPTSQANSVNKKSLINELYLEDGSPGFPLNVINPLELRFIELPLNESHNFDPELIRDYFNDFELDHDLSLDITSDTDEYGGFYSIYFDLHKLNKKMVTDLENSIKRACNQEGLFFESGNINGDSIEDPDSLIKELGKWVKLRNHPNDIEIILQKK